jgi:hypothetical protein
MNTKPELELAIKACKRILETESVKAGKFEAAWNTSLWCQDELARLSQQHIPAFLKAQAH